MSTQSAMQKSPLDAIPAAQNNLIVQHLRTTETSTPSARHEGKEWARTDHNRIYTADGALNPVMTGWYEADGRMGMSAGTTPSGLASGVGVQVPWSPTYDSEAAYVGFDGTNFAYVIPATGLWIMSVWMHATSAPGGNDWHLELMSGTTVLGFQPGNGLAGDFGTLTLMAPFPVGLHLGIRLFQNSGAPIDIGSAFWYIYRLGA
jgi:hypothetical protein